MRPKLHLVLLTILISIFACTANAQLLKDTLSQRQIKQALDKIYNFEFETAELLISFIQKRYSGHPVSSMLMAIFTSWKNFPMDPQSQAYQVYQNYLKQSLEPNKLNFGEDTDNPEGIFFALSAHSYLAMVAAEEKEYIKAVAEAKKAYVFMKKGFDLMNTYPEFYFSTGLYNYYVEQYPENHQAVKPFMLFFTKGNRELGLQQMEKSLDAAIFTGAEACFWLAHIYIKHELKPQKALSFTRLLIKKYPSNLHYAMRHAEMLIACGKYQEAQPFINQLLAHPHKMFGSAAYIFPGLIQEKHEQNYALARLNFQRSFKLSSFDKRYTKDYYAMAYAGLARIAHKEGNQQSAREYYKKALELAEYESIIKEAK